jgi:sec-independent protein translocase protein TatB
MFNIGFGELAVICIIMIIALGPDRLPEAMKTVGKTLRTLRQASRDIRASTGIDDLMRDDHDMRRPPPRRPAPVIAASGPAPVSRTLSDTTADTTDATSEAKSPEAGPTQAATSLTPTAPIMNAPVPVSDAAPDTSATSDLVPSVTTQPKVTDRS